MTTYYMAPYANTQTTPATLPDAQKGYGGKTITLMGTLTYAAQASGSLIVIGVAQPGWLFQGGALYTDTSTSSATLAVGGTLGGTQTFQANCYKAAAALTSTDSWASFLSYVSATHPFLTDPLAPYTGSEAFTITTASASLPASGILCARLHFMIS